MFIKQQRIINLSKLSFVNKNESIRVGVINLDRFKRKLVEIGFGYPVEPGYSILPNKIGPVSRRNADGDYLIDKSKEMETHHRMIEWTYKQWAGRGETVEVTDSTTVPYQRYPRTFIPPLSVELTVVQKDQELHIVSPTIFNNQENEALIKHTVNLFLELFGECYILDKESKALKIPKLIKLNWQVLPKGKIPWDKRKEQIKDFISRAKGINQTVVGKRLEEIIKYKPELTAIGSGGFNDYIIFGFIDKNIYVLESIYTNNATYILENDWESISKLTKAEILNNNLHKDRIIHSKNWYKKINDLLGDKSNNIGSQYQLVFAN